MYKCKDLVLLLLVRALNFLLYNKVMDENFNIVLVEPEIPQNTGNIARLCACTGCNLYIAGKPGFLMTDKYMKRSGLDYWDKLNLIKVDTLEELIDNNKNSNFYFLTTKSEKRYTGIKFKKGDFLVFGPETRGLNEELLKKYSENAITIPMKAETRSLNLSNSVAIVTYEAIRQNGLL